MHLKSPWPNQLHGTLRKRKPPEQFWIAFASELMLATRPSLAGEVDEIRVATSWSEVVGGPAPPNLNGDFNSDGKVDAGDYVTWAKNNGTSNALANDNGLGVPIGTGHYDLWRGNFGNPPGSGSSLVGASVPEPASWLLIPMAAVVLAFATRRRAVAMVVLERARSSRSR